MGIPKGGQVFTKYISNTEAKNKHIRFQNLELIRVLTNLYKSTLQRAEIDFQLLDGTKVKMVVTATQGQRNDKNTPTGQMTLKPEGISLFAVLSKHFWLFQPCHGVEWH